MTKGTNHERHVGCATPVLRPTNYTIPDGSPRYGIFETKTRCFASLRLVIIRKKIDDGKFYEGEVTKYDKSNKFYSIEYRDGDREEYTHDEVASYRKNT